MGEVPFNEYAISDLELEPVELEPRIAGVLSDHCDQSEVIAEALRKMASRERHQASWTERLEPQQDAAVAVASASESVLGPAAARFAFAEIYERPVPVDGNYDDPAFRKEHDEWLDDQAAALHHEAEEAIVEELGPPVLEETRLPVGGIFAASGTDHELSGEPPPLDPDDPEFSVQVALRYRSRIRALLTSEEYAEPKKVRAMVEAYIDAEASRCEVNEALGAGVFRGMAPTGLAQLDPVASARLGSATLIGLEQSDIDDAVAAMKQQRDQQITADPVDDAVQQVQQSGIERAARRLTKIIEDEIQQLGSDSAYLSCAGLSEDKAIELFRALRQVALPTEAMLDHSLPRFITDERRAYRRRRATLLVRSALERAVLDPEIWDLLADRD